MIDEAAAMQVVQRKRQQRESLIPSEWRLQGQITESGSVLDVPKTCGVLTERELDITSRYDAVDIVHEIRYRHFSAEEVTRAFCKRAAIAQQLVSPDIGRGLFSADSVDRLPHGDLL
jgi:amidase